MSCFASLDQVVREFQQLVLRQQYRASASVQALSKQLVRAFRLPCVRDTMTLEVEMT